VRGTAERSFGTLKEAYGLTRASYIGTLKVELEFLLCAIDFNLKKAVYLVPRWEKRAQHSAKTGKCGEKRGKRVKSPLKIRKFTSM
jgi:hypothetical protein